MTERFIKGYCCGDVGLVDKEKEEWFVENINSISDSERNWNDVLDKLNEVAEENEQLKKDCTVLICHNQEYRKENEQLKHKLKSLNDNFNHLKRLFDEIEEPISDELLAEYSRIVVEGFK